MRILIPVMKNSKDTEISLHFGHAPFFAIFDTTNNELIFEKNILIHNNPEKSAVDQAIELFKPQKVLVNNIGQKAKNIFESKNIELKTGVKGLLSDLDFIK